MTREEARMKLYKLNNTNRTVRQKMMKTLKLSCEGEAERAKALFNEYAQEFEQVKQEHNTILREMEDVSVEDASRSIGFTNILQETIAQVNSLQSRNCPAVRFHVYN